MLSFMARLTHRLWSLLQGGPKQRLFRLFKFVKWHSKEEPMPDLELVPHTAGEHKVQDTGCLPEDANPDLKHGCLLPGLPNEVIVEFILTKLPWTTLYVVSTLNHAWQDVFRAGEVHDARVRSGNGETLIVMTHAYPDPNDRIFQGVSLYDPSRDAWHLLPPLPRVKGGITSKYECAIVNGKIFVIGGLTIDYAAVSWKALLMLDLATCQGVWTECADMKLSRSQFACQVKDDKIYVFGGLNEHDQLLDEAHVYDPLNNSWTEVSSMGYKRSAHKAICLDGSLYLCGGSIWCDSTGRDGGIDHKSFHQQGWRKKRAQDADFMEIYDSKKNEWLAVENFTKGRSFRGSYFVVDEHLYHLNHKGIDEYDKQSNEWHSFSREPWSDIENSEVCAAEVLKGELFALVLSRRENENVTRGSLATRYNFVAVPVMASWSGSRSSQLTWKKMHCPYDFNWASCSIHSVLI